MRHVHLHDPADPPPSDALIVIQLPAWFDDVLLESCLRRGMPLDDLLIDALVHAVTAP